MRQQHAKYSNNLVRRSARDRASNNTGNDIESGWSVNAANAKIINQRFSLLCN